MFVVEKKSWDELVELILQSISYSPIIKEENEKYYYSKNHLIRLNGKIVPLNIMLNPRNLFTSFFNSASGDLIIKRELRKFKFEYFKPTKLLNIDKEDYESYKEEYESRYLLLGKEVYVFFNDTLYFAFLHLRDIYDKYSNDDDRDNSIRNYKLYSVMSYIVLSEYDVECSDKTIFKTDEFDIYTLKSFNTFLVNTLTRLYMNIISEIKLEDMEYEE